MMETWFLKPYYAFVVEPPWLDNWDAYPIVHAPPDNLWDNQPGELDRWADDGGANVV